MLTALSNERPDRLPCQVHGWMDYYLNHYLDGMDWWEAYDRRRGRVSSRHLSNQALDVVPAHSRLEFVEKVKELVPIAGTGVRKIIPKGTLGEPVDHVEFTFKVCPDHG